MKTIVGNEVTAKCKNFSDNVKDRGSVLVTREGKLAAVDIPKPVEEGRK
jgi:PHD/YefM family antitoxin component YafN of YafNO toxin-antitoxin module